MSPCRVGGETEAQGIKHLAQAQWLLVVVELGCQPGRPGSEALALSQRTAALRGGLLGN